MKKITIDPKNIDSSLVKEAAEQIMEGGIVALPTETVYGLAGITSKKQVEDRLYTIKHRPREKPFAFAVGDTAGGVATGMSAIYYGNKLLEKATPYLQKVGININKNSIAGVIDKTGMAGQINKQMAKFATQFPKTTAGMKIAALVTLPVICLGFIVKTFSDIANIKKNETQNYNELLQAQRETAVNYANALAAEKYSS